MGLDSVIPSNEYRACFKFCFHNPEVRKDWKDIMRDMREETALYSLWWNYAAENSYAEGLEFHVLLDTATEIAELIGIDSKLEIKRK